MTAISQQHSAPAALPLNAAITLLRRLGLTLIGAVIRQEPSPLLAREIRRQEVKLLLPYAGRANTIALTPYSIRPWLRQAGWFVGREFRRRWLPPEIQADLQHQIKRALHRDITEQQWKKLTTAWIDRTLGGLSGEWLAEPFWEIAAEAAWGAADFQAEVSRLLIAELRTRVLFTPGEPPVPFITPTAVWSLVALAEIGKPVPWKLLLRRRATILGLRRLQHTASRATLVPGWAAVWDQWLITEALRIWNAAAKRLTPELHTAMLALPLYRRCNQITTPVDSPYIALAAADWEHHLPPWIDTLARWDREPISPVQS